jgi:predicted DNA-binding transcriptional regulator AlpA
MFSDFESLPDGAFIRLNQLISTSLVPFSVATLWRRVKEGRFPSPIKLSNQITAWRVSDVREWMADPVGYVQSGQRRV